LQTEKARGIRVHQTLIASSKKMTERRIYQKLNDLGYSNNNTQGRNPKSSCIEEEVAIFNFLLPKYDSAFALGDWLSTDERKTTILRYVPAPPPHPKVVRVVSLPA
jgi:hypothetical protein